MLVIKRNTQEGTTLTLPDGSTIHIVAVECRGGWCRIGIEAGQDVKISRDELLRKVVVKPSAMPANADTRKAQATCGICGNASCDNPGGKH